MKPSTRDTLAAAVICALLLLTGVAIAYGGRYWASVGVQV